ncbi:MAG: copper homeostasis protein CutC [Traorella sp.]
MINNVKVEICCGTIDDCICAAKFDIDRIELNSALELGGLTPSLATLRMAKKLVKQPICCMVRPRTSGFRYTPTQIEGMFMDAKILLEEGADGIVFGFLNQEHQVDKELTSKMVDLIHSYGKEAVFHKAFDECYDLDQACQDLIDCKVDRILTGGGKCSIEEGSVICAQLFDKYGDKIELLIGGGVRVHNINTIAQTAHTGQIHMTAKKTYFDDGEYVQVDEETLRRALEMLRK